MIVGRCFEGDVDMALCGIQHDLYFASRLRPEVMIDGSCALWWIWRQVVSQAAQRRSSVAWLDRNMDRIRAIDGFNHKLLQIPHEHIAAYHRWTMPRVAPTHPTQVYPQQRYTAVGPVTAASGHGPAGFQMPYGAARPERAKRSTQPLSS